MAKKAAVRIALDLETTGLHADQDAILEVAAIKFQGKDVIDTFETFVSPGRPVPYRVQRLTGIKPEQLIGAPPFDAIAKKLQFFLGELPIVGHSIPFDVNFLRRWGLGRNIPLVDTFELATVLLPSLASYNLGQVAESLGLAVPDDRHRAMVDTVLAMDVFLALHERLQTVDLALLKDLANLDAPRSWPLLHFFRQELRDRQEHDGVRGGLARGSLGDRFAAQLGMDPRMLTFAIARQSDASQEQAVSSVDPQLQVATQEKLKQIETSVEVISDQRTEPVPQTYQTARLAMREAFEQHTSLLMEITVGGSEYTPALLPVLEWIVESSNNTESPSPRLMIVCSIQHNARRLMDTGLTHLQP